MCFHTPFMSSHRYMTALTDSEEEEPNEGEQGDKKQAEDELNVLLKEVDRLHEGTEFDKRESLNILLKQEAEVCILAFSLSSAEYRGEPDGFVHFTSLDRTPGFCGG